MPDALAPIDRFFVLHSDADILLSLSTTFFERQKADATWLKAASPLLNQLYRATILLGDLIHEGWPRFAETLTVGTTEEFFEALRYFAPRFAAEVQTRAENADRFFEETHPDADPAQVYAIEAQEVLNHEVARALRLHRLALEPLLPAMETHAKKHRAERERQQGKAAWRALGAAS